MTAPDFSDFYRLPLVGILRGCSSEHLPDIIRAVRQGGMRYLEITMNTPSAGKQIRDAIQIAEGAISIGAGTVTSEKLLAEALSAGADFIVTPAVNRCVLEFCEDAGIPICPGAFSPNEVATARELAPNLIAAVKIFPADHGGPDYLRGLKEVFPDIPLMPTGGVDLSTLSHFIAAGASGFGLGSPLFQKERINGREWTWLENQVRAYVETFKTVTAGTHPPCVD